MDRDRLNAWLSSPHRTWRWNDGESPEYHGVSTSDEGLSWFAHSHVFGDDGVSGRRGATSQSFAAFLRDGPLCAMPESMRAELEAWIRAHAAD
jgi:hypothetical protein